MMKKSLLALSVAAAAMGAQAADVQVYGLIDTSLSFVSSDADFVCRPRPCELLLDGERKGIRLPLRSQGF